MGVVTELVDSKCPRCQHVQECGCASCMASNPDRKKPWVWKPNDCIACGNCGYTLHSTVWFDLHYDAVKKANAEKNKSEETNRTAGESTRNGDEQV